MDIEDDFFSLFAKGASKSPVKFSKQQVATANTKECVKLLEAKRSQAIGILMSSKRLDSSLVKDVLMEFNNQILNYETLNEIYMQKPSEEELRIISEYVKNLAPEDALEESMDKPELFLYEISKVPAYEERMYCLVYQNRFREMISSIEFRLNNIGMVCDELMNNEKIKRILGIVLACGNSMNAANMSRGDADGFDLSILPKLKDVKSKDNSTNLLQYVVYYYVNKIDEDATKLPIPDPSDFTAVADVNFADLEKELQSIRHDIKRIEEKLETVFKASEPNRLEPIKNSDQETDQEAAEKSSGSNKSSDDDEQQPTAKPVATAVKDKNEPFRTLIYEFLKRASDEVKEQEENYGKSLTKFKTTVDSYCMQPTGSDKEIKPSYFFQLWCAFAQDFKNEWKREQLKLTKERLKALNEKRNQIKTTNTTITPTTDASKASKLDKKKSIVS